ncbi:dihydroorotase [Bremerella cremea]|uniref:Dihydroorotase n=1 Tax=Bremerella cremea TaxID=1031537 RepID=A0A368KJY3_9BACT|nr:dihydroorotase [Bremerella cremea]RCS41067.1 dihydroorotase [Bremerella cremea]
MPRTLILNGRVIDPSQGIDRITNLLIDEGRIGAIDVDANTSAARVIDASGKLVVPGLIDLNVQIREPGFEEDETIESAAFAALAGGFTSIAAISETNPPVDSAAAVTYLGRQATDADHCNVYPVACVSSGRQGEEMAEIGILNNAGAIAFSDGQRPVSNPELLRRALEYTLMFNRPVLNRPEMVELSRDGVMHDGKVSTVLGLAPMPTEAEDVMAARDIRICEATGGKLHLLGISCSGTVEILRRAKMRSVGVTASICAYQFAETDEAMRDFHTSFKLNPPLRSADHIKACIAGLKDGTIDVIASGHAPRSSEKKMCAITEAPFGMVGLETALGLVSTHLVAAGHLDWSTVIKAMSFNAAQVLGLAKGTLQVGADADITIIDPQHRWTVDTTDYRSKSFNCPFHGVELIGRAVETIVGGVSKFRYDAA